MGENFTAVISITIYAPTAQVWDALVNPDMIKQYLFGTEAVSDWKQGSPIVYRGVWEGNAYEDKGIILKIEPEKVLETTYWSSFSGTPDSPENYQKVSYAVETVDVGTELTIIQEGIADEAKRDHTVQNWTMVLESLKKLLEQK